MKYLVFLVFLILLASCDDGDLQIESIDFDNVSINSCDEEEDATETTFFFKIEGDEALLLNLNDGLLENSTSLDGSIEASISASGRPQLIYRLFTGDVNSSYFCDEIPPLEPTVLVENLAEGGDITILTNVGRVTTTQKVYNHNITIRNLTLLNAQDERLTDTSTLEYGDFETPTANSPSLTFSNYANIDVIECGTPPTDNFVRLAKVNGDEFLSLDIPANLLQNMVTEPEMPRVDTLQTNTVFRNVVLNDLVTNVDSCATTVNEEILVGTYTSSGGTVEVTTTASEPNNEGVVTYTHTITLRNLELELQIPDQENTQDLNDIDLFVFGSITNTNQ